MRFFYIMAAILVASSSHEVEKRQTKSSKDLGEKRVVCYYTNWSVYRKGLAKYTPKNINPYLCTHLVYAFGGLTDEFEVTTFDSYQDIEQGGYAQFNGLKQYNKDTKTLLALGGWNEGSTRFSELVSFKEYRDNFTLSVIKHLRRYNFDGLDLDWEYPGSRDGSTPEDKQNYATLVMELREAFEAEAAKSSKPRLLLTMAVPAGQNYIDKGYDIPTLNKYLDFFNLLSYDYHSIYEPSINHHAALLPPPGISEYEVNYQLNVDWTVRYYLKKGASMNKLVVGIPTYGRSYTLLDENFFTIGSSADGPGIKGNYTNEKGYLAFYEICESISLYGWEVRKPYPKRVGPFAFKGNQWVGYDDEKIAVRKAEYVRENGLGGIMFWTLDSDDFRGLCNGREYPLIEAAKAALYQPSLTDENEARAVGLSRADSTSGNAITNRLNVNRPQQRAQTTTTTEEPSRRRPGRRRPGSQTAVSIDPFNTPEPPTTPSSVKAFHCKREGFYPNPDDCNKYYWCLNSGTSGLGIVAHSFTCPSDLIFSKKIDGCDHPNRVKCKVSANPGRGGPTIPPTTTPIPTTTEFEYLLDDFDYYYDYDFVDKPNQPLQEVAQIENFLEQNINQPIRNAGGSQFQEVTETETKKEEPVPPEPEVVRSRTPERPGAGDRPQYSSIQRDRSRLREETVVEEQPTIAESESPSSRPQRPQYVTLNRQRPASVNVVDQQEEAFVGVVDSTPESVDGLTYVTLERNRHPSTEPSVFDESELTTAGLEYVTLNRAKPSTTKEPGSDYLYDYYTDEELSEVPAPQEATTAAVATTTTTTTTETTTTEKPRIRLPPRLRASRPRPSPRPRPSFRGRPAPQTVQPVEEGEEKLDRRTRFRGRTTPQPEETKEEEKVDRLTRFRGRLTPRPVEPREQEEADRSTRLRGRPNPQLVLPREEKESVITELPTELPQVTSTPEPDKPLTATPELLQEALAKPVELLVDSVEPTQGSVDVDAKTADQSVEPTEQPKEAVTQPEEAIEPEKSVPKFQDGDSLIEETLLLFKKNKQELENEPSPERESRIRPFLGRRREEPSSKILETTTEVKELPETATIPVSPLLRPLPVRPLSHSVASFSPVETFSNLLHAEDHVSVLSPGDQDETSQDSLKTHSRASTNIPFHTQTLLLTEHTQKQHASKSPVDRLNKTTLTLPLTRGAFNINNTEDLKSIYYGINNQTLNLRSRVDNIELTQADLDDIVYLYSKFIEIDDNLDIVSAILSNLKSDNKSALSSAIDELTSKMDGVPFNTSDVSHNLIEGKSLVSQSSVSDPVILSPESFESVHRDNKLVPEKVTHSDDMRILNDENPHQETESLHLGSTEIIPTEEVLQYETTTILPKGETTINDDLATSDTNQDMELGLGITEVIPIHAQSQDTEFGLKVTGALQTEAPYEEVTTRSPPQAQDIMGINSEGKAFRLKKIRTRVVASPIRVVIGDNEFVYPFLSKENTDHTEMPHMNAPINSFFDYEGSISLQKQLPPQGQPLNTAMNKSSSPVNKFLEDHQDDMTVIDNSKLVSSNPPTDSGIIGDSHSTVIEYPVTDETFAYIESLKSISLVPTEPDELVSATEATTKNVDYVYEDYYIFEDEYDALQNFTDYQQKGAKAVLLNESRSTQETSTGDSMYDDKILLTSSAVAMPEGKNMANKENVGTEIINTDYTEKERIRNPENSNFKTSTPLEDMIQDVKTLSKDEIRKNMEGTDNLSRDFNSKVTHEADIKVPHENSTPNGHDLDGIIPHENGTTNQNRNLLQEKDIDESALAVNNLRETNLIHQELREINYERVSTNRDVITPTPVAVTTIEDYFYDYDSPVTERNILKFASPTNNPGLKVIHPLKPVSVDNLFKFGARQQSRKRINETSHLFFESNPLAPIHNARIPFDNGFSTFALKKDRDNFIIPEDIEKASYPETRRNVSPEEIQFSSIPSEAVHFNNPSNTDSIDPYLQTQFDADTPQTNQSPRNDESFLHGEGHQISEMHDSDKSNLAGFDDSLLDGVAHSKQPQALADDLKSLKLPSHDRFSLHEDDGTLRNQPSFPNYRGVTYENPSPHTHNEGLSKDTQSTNEKVLSPSDPPNDEQTLLHTDTSSPSDREDKTHLFTTAVEVSKPLAGQQKQQAPRGFSAGDTATRRTHLSSRGRPHTRGNRRRPHARGRDRSARRPPTRGKGKIVLRRKILGGDNDTPVNIFTYPFVYGDGQVHLRS